MAQNVQLPADGSVEAAIKRVQKASEDSYLVVGYEGKNKIIVLAEGVGGLDDVSSYFVKDDARYFYFRKSHQVELASTVKFVFIDHTPSGISPLRKALLSTHKGQINDLFKPAHVAFQIGELSEVSEDIIRERIGFASGTKLHVTDAVPEQRAGGIQKAEIKKPASAATPRSSAGSAGAGAGKDVLADGAGPLKLSDGDAISNAIKAVRADNNPINWCYVEYNGQNSLALVAQGEGGLAELLDRLDDSKTSYSFFRVTEQFDQSVTVKFGFIKLVTQQIRPLDRARISTHRGFVVNLFSPFHNEFEIGSKSEVSEQRILDTIGSYSGVKSKVVDSGIKEAEAARQEERLRKIEEEKKSGPQVVKDAPMNIVFADQDAFKRAIAAVRDDSDPTTWALFQLEGKNEIAVHATGSDELAGDALKAAVTAQECSYGLVRVTDQIDKSVTVKFVYIRYHPTSTSPTKKAILSTLKGAIDGLFMPYHVDFFIESLEEISHAVILDKVQSTSGTKSKVRNDE